jgi:TPR repeat protein
MCLNIDKRINMKTLTVALLLSTLSAFTSWAGDFQKGVSAFQGRNYTTALQEFTELAEQGDASSQMYLGFMYKHGMGVDQSYKQAVEWFTKAATQGDAESEFYLGAMNNSGQGVPQSYKRAAQWYTKAAEQGYTEAQYALARIYAHGEGVPQDNIYAHMWFNLAAADGHEIARNNRDSIAKEMTTADIVRLQMV